MAKKLIKIYNLVFWKRMIKAISGLSLQAIMILILVNLGLVYTIKIWLIKSQNCMTTTQVSSDARCLYIYNNKVFEKGTRNNPHHGNPCGMDVTSIIPAFHLANVAFYLDPNYTADICTAPPLTATPTPTAVPTLTRAPTATLTPMPTLVPTATPTSQLGASATPTRLPTATPTIFIVPTATPTWQAGLSATPTVRISATLTPTARPSFSPTPTPIGGVGGPGIVTANTPTQTRFPTISATGNLAAAVVKVELPEVVEVTSGGQGSVPMRVSSLDGELKEMRLVLEIDKPELLSSAEVKLGAGFEDWQVVTSKTVGSRYEILIKPGLRATGFQGADTELMEWGFEAASVTEETTINVGVGVGGLPSSRAMVERNGSLEMAEMTTNKVNLIIKPVGSSGTSTMLTPTVMPNEVPAIQLEVKENKLVWLTQVIIYISLGLLVGTMGWWVGLIGYRKWKGKKK